MRVPTHRFRGSPRGRILVRMRGTRPEGPMAREPNTAHRSSDRWSFVPAATESWRGYSHAGFCLPKLKLLHATYLRSSHIPDLGFIFAVRSSWFQAAARMQVRQTVVDQSRCDRRRVLGRGVLSAERHTHDCAVAM